MRPEFYRPINQRHSLAVIVVGFAWRTLAHNHVSDFIQADNLEGRGSAISVAEELFRLEAASSVVKQFLSCDSLPLHRSFDFLARRSRKPKFHQTHSFG